MADDNNDVDQTEDSTEDSGSGGPKELREALERRNAELKERDAELSGLRQFQREAQFEKAGFDSGNALHKLVMDQYEGEMDVKSIKSFTESSFPELLTQSATPQPAQPADLSAFGRMDQASSGASPTGAAPEPAFKAAGNKQAFLEAAARALNEQKIDFS